VSDKTLAEVALTHTADSGDVASGWVFYAYGSSADWAVPWSVIEAMIVDESLAAIIGGASTIVETDLTASRALVSNGSGKVAVSSVTAAELAYVSGVTSAVQTQLNAKQATITGAATTVVSSDLTASRVVVSNSSGKIAAASVTATELGYLAGVTSAIQTQLDAKAASSHSHDASAITSGTIDVARLPFVSSGVQEVSSGAIADLSSPQQANIVKGAIVTTSDGRRWVYSGSGSKTSEASYVEMSDVTPEWSVVANKPANVVALATVSDPNEDKIWFWDDSVGGFSLLAIGTGLAITGTTIAIAGISIASSQYYSARFAGSVTVNWNNGNVQAFTLANGANTITMSNPQAGARYLLEIKQPASSSAGTVTWPANVKWSGGTAPTLSTTNGRSDLVALYYNGTNYAGSAVLDFAL